MADLGQRGQEVAIRISIDGQPMTGSWLAIDAWTTTPRQDLNEHSYLGEAVDRISFQHHGWDFAFSVRNEDEKTLEFLDDIIDREENSLRPPDITITVIHTYRERGTQNKVEVFHSCLLRIAELGFGGRREMVMTRFEGKAERRSLVNGD